jgi:hypothetical protein
MTLRCSALLETSLMDSFRQDPKTLPAPPGVVYNTSMTRPDAALALAALYVSASRRQTRVDGVCITGSGLDAAIFCDVVGRFYTGQGRAPGSNAVLPVGFPADAPIPANPPMVKAAITRMRPDGQPQYARGVQKVTDTAAPDALLRNAVTFTAETIVVLSAPATWLLRSLELAGTVAQYTQRVKRVVIVEANGAGGDPALTRLTALLPVPVVTCPPEIGMALAVPRAQVEAGFAWTNAHPVADAVRAWSESSIPLHDVAAVHYALHPDSEFYSVSQGRLVVEPSQRAACAAALVELATSKPAAAPAKTG